MYSKLSKSNSEFILYPTTTFADGVDNLKQLDTSVRGRVQDVHGCPTKESRMSDLSYVVDYAVISKYYHARQLARKDLGADSPEFNIWKLGHKSECQQSYSGSSSGMEAFAAELLWKRSIDYGMRCTTLLSDGDSKTFNHLQNLNIYKGGVCESRVEMTSLVWKRKIAIAVAIAVSDINHGYSKTMTRTLQQADVSPGHQGIKTSIARDRRSIRNRILHSTQMKMVKIRAEAALKQQKGSTD
ncbi:hypothetical protein ANN_27427 [Periplaneta americana]|uniref:Mutator-like transposase domain-containing protein n=1 Tax=Periplaneta americana TaxID=6978 RepID=A0ABQ8RVR0_PERAM|nr:hypothetical protein ANN_27427 [Periplaneta americana]